MQANLMKMGFGLLFLLATAVVFLVLFSGSPAVAAGEGEAFIFLPGEAPRYGGQAERQISPNCWRQLSKLGAWSASFAKLSRLRAALLRTCTEWKLNSVAL